MKDLLLGCCCSSACWEVHHVLRVRAATQLVRRGELWIAALYVGSSVVLGIAAVWVGIRAIGLLPR